MLHSCYANKDTYEDDKTSSVFENLILLPDNVLWFILRKSCLFHEALKQSSGRLISYNFWPHWSSRGTGNVNFIEPDLFLRFEEFDVIIEAKYGDLSGQYHYQWEQELIAYYNEYEEEGKNVIFIALGGNSTMERDSLKIRGHICNIYKCNWLSLLVSINKYKNELKNISSPDMNISSLLRILDNIILAFNINGVYNIDWFNSLEKGHTSINASSINNIKKYFVL